MIRNEIAITQFHKKISDFTEFGTATKVLMKDFQGLLVPIYVNEFWTAKQRAAHSLHEVSYRACFKPQLPRFFIECFTEPGEKIYDPFMGRGTTLLEAALMNRIPVGCDVNPLSALLCMPRLHAPSLSEIKKRLDEIPLDTLTDIREDLLVFYHSDTLKELSSLREYFLSKEKQKTLDSIDSWIRMVATNRLTGHSPGFFSVYTLPPNQAVSVASQIRINEKRQQTPPPRDIRAIILKKSKSLLGDLTAQEKNNLQAIGGKSQCVTANSQSTPTIEANSIALVVTSPPFLDIVIYF